MRTYDAFEESDEFVDSGVSDSLDCGDNSICDDCADCAGEEDFAISDGSDLPASGAFNTYDVCVESNICAEFDTRDERLTSDVYDWHDFDAFGSCDKYEQLTSETELYICVVYALQNCSELGTFAEFNVSSI